MAKYKFNLETLSYEKDRRAFKSEIRSILIIIPASLLLAIALSFAFLYLYEPPGIQMQKKENQELLAKYELMEKNVDDMQGVINDLQERDDNLYRVVFEADPIPSSLRTAGFNGINRYEELEKLDNSGLVRKTAEKLDMLTKNAYLQSKSFEELASLAKKKEDMLACIPAIMPVSNSDLKRTASGWGYRIHPVYKISKFHFGMDFTASTGTNIYATGDGIVRTIDIDNNGYGMHVIIDHGFGYRTLYGHMSGFNVKIGEAVKRGSIIGYVGNTGTSTGAHLHYEVHKNGVPVNPQHYYFKDLNTEEYDQMVAISSNVGQTLD